MKIINILLLGLVLNTYGCSLVQEKHALLDPGFEEFERAYWAEIKKCWGSDTEAERKACEQDIDERFTNDPRERGYTYYVETYYTTLDDLALRAKLAELEALREAADSYPRDFDRPAGVLSKQILSYEIASIQSLLTRRDLAGYGYSEANSKDY